MGEDPRQTVIEIEQTRENLGRKVDLLMDQAKVEAAAVGKKVAGAAVALTLLFVVGLVARRRVDR